MADIAVYVVDYAAVADAVAGQVGVAVGVDAGVLASGHIGIAPGDVEGGVSAAAVSLQLQAVAVTGYAFYLYAAVGAGYAAGYHLGLDILVVKAPQGVLAVGYGLSGAGVDGGSVKGAVALHQLY